MVSAFLRRRGRGRGPARPGPPARRGRPRQEKAGDLAAAAEAYREALRLAPRFAEAHDRLGFVLGRLGQTEDALDGVPPRDEANPSSSTRSTTWARRSGGRRGGRRAHAARGRGALRPADAEARYYLGLRSTKRQGRGGRRATCARRSRAPRRSPWPTCSSAWRCRTGAIGRRGRALRKAVALDPGDATRQHPRARPDAEGRGGRGRRDASRARGRAPRRTTARQNLGTALLQKGDLDGAIARLPRSASPRAAERRGVLQPRRRAQAEGRLRRRRGGAAPGGRARPDAAGGPTRSASCSGRRSAGRGRRGVPRRDRAHAGLRRRPLHARHGPAPAGRPDDALAEFRETLGIEPASAEAHLSIGQVLQRKGDGEGSAAALAEADRLNQQKADAQAAVFAVDRQATLAAGRPPGRPRQLARGRAPRPRRSEAHYQLALALEPQGARARPGRTSTRRAGSRRTCAPVEHRPRPAPAACGVKRALLAGSSRPSRSPALGRGSRLPVLVPERRARGRASTRAHHLRRHEDQPLPARDDGLRRGVLRLRQRRPARTLFFVNGTTLEGFPKGRSRPATSTATGATARFEDVTARAGLARSAGWGQGACAGDYDNDGYDGPLRHLLRAEPPVPQPRRRHASTTSRPRPASRSRARAGAPAARSSTTTATASSISSSPTTSTSTSRPRRRPTRACAATRASPWRAARPGSPAARTCSTTTAATARSRTSRRRRASRSATGTYGLGVSTFDFDDDGWTDLYVANDSNPSALYRNNHDGTFEDIAVDGRLRLQPGRQAAGGHGRRHRRLRPQRHDGHLQDELRRRHSTLYANTGDGFCEDRTFATGLGLNTRWLGWGAGFVDLDNDGWLDIFLANGHVYPEVAQISDRGRLRAAQGRLPQPRKRPLRGRQRAARAAGHDAEGRPRRGVRRLRQRRRRRRRRSTT